MASTLLFFSVLLLSLASAHSSLPLLRDSAIDYTLFPFSSRQARRCPSIPFKSSESGYIQVTTLGVSVTRGATASVSFSVTINALSARTLTNADARYVNALPAELKKSYMKKKEAYKGGIDIPFLLDLGADLRKLSLSGKEVSKRNKSKKAFAKRVCAAARIVNRVPGGRVRIEGRRSVSGTSFIPKTVFGFARVGIITTAGGKRRTVVSTDPRDFVVATKDGTVVAMGVKGVSVTQL